MIYHISFKYLTLTYFRKLNVEVIVLQLKHAPIIWLFQLKISQMETRALSAPHPSVMQTIEKNCGKLCWYLPCNYSLLVDVFNFNLSESKLCLRMEILTCWVLTTHPQLPNSNSSMRGTFSRHGAVFLPYRSISLHNCLLATLRVFHSVTYGDLTPKEIC